MRITKQLRSLGLAALFVLGLAATVFAYEGQIAGQVVVSGPNNYSLSCNDNWYIYATVTAAADNTPIDGKHVTWSIASTPASGDYLTDSTTVTDANGQTRTTLHLTSEPGSRTIQAQVSNTDSTAPSGRITVNCTAGGLPPTSVAGPSDPVTPFNWGLVAAALAMITGFGILTFRFVRR